MIPIIDPSDSVIYRLNWINLPTGATLGTVTHTVPSPLTKLSETTVAVSAYSEVKITGAVHGGIYMIEGQSTLSNGETINRQFPVRSFNV